MDKGLFDTLVQEIKKDVLGSHYADLIAQAQATLERLDAASREYREAIEETGRLALSYSDIEDTLDLIRSEIEVELTFNSEVVTGKNKETRERQIAVYLGKLRQGDVPERQVERDYILYAAAEAEARQLLDSAKFLEESAKKEWETARRMAWVISKMLPVVEAGY